MKIGDRAYSEFQSHCTASGAEKAHRDEVPRDEVSLSGRKSDDAAGKTSPHHLSRSVFSALNGRERDAAGPLTQEQSHYFDQEFDHPRDVTKLKTLFGLGGVLLPDSAGRIKHLALQFGNVEFNKPLPEKTQKALLGVYRTLFTNMSSDTRFTIVAADEKGIAILKKTVEESGMENPGRVNIVDGKAEKGFSIWIRDSMIPVEDEDESAKLLIQDRTYWPGPEDAKIPSLIAQSNPDVTSQAHTALRIDGGNLVSNQDYIIIGHDSVEQTTNRLKELAAREETKREIIRFYEVRTGKEVVEGAPPTNPNQVTLEEMWAGIAPEVFRSEFQRKVFIISKDDPATPAVEEQPAFHIDMAVTPIENDMFLVGDPGMAIRELKGLSPEEKAKVNRSMAKEAGLPEDADLIGKLIEVNGSPEHQANFDNVDRELRGKGFQTRRIPCFIGLRTTWSLPYLTYNNCIQENYIDESGKRVKNVYLPTYGCEPLEKIARAAYEDLGFKVIPLKMAAVSILEGAIRCSSYPLSRTDVPAPDGK